jgi:hypothetical protein
VRYGLIEEWDAALGVEKFLLEFVVCRYCYCQPEGLRVQV